MFPEGVLHIVNLNHHVSMTMNRHTCKLSYKAQQTNTVAGGTGRFAHAAGSFASTVTAPAVAHRKSRWQLRLAAPPDRRDRHFRGDREADVLISQLGRRPGRRSR